VKPLITLDFETLAIDQRPNFPPKPVGLAYKVGGERSGYMAWGHPSGNNCTEGDAKQFLSKVLDGGYEILFHNAKFDLAVLLEGMGFEAPPWQNIHDTLFLLFLVDPHARSFKLKDVAEEMLDWPPEEQDAIAEYVWEHRKRLVEEYGGKVTRAKSGPGSAGAWIGRCPAGIVKPYACGDVDRTYAIFKHLVPIVRMFDMWEAYNRERRLLPILLENERIGMRVSLWSLKNDIDYYQEALSKAERWICKELGSADLNLDADRQLADALERADAVEEGCWVLTNSGQRSVSKENLKPHMFKDPRLAMALGYRNRLKTCLGTFMQPWLAQAEARGGWISTNWNQVRGGAGGTRTGRPSTSSPNLLNISKNFEGRDDGYVHPNFLGLRSLPLVRKYILPDEGHLFLHRDFDGQELRVFGHFECGPLQQAYIENPELDPHKWVKENLEQLRGQEFTRGMVKILNFQAIYGGGAPAAAKKLDCSLAEAKEYKAFHDRALPGRKVLNEEILRVVRSGYPVKTWGGRTYYPEEPKVVNGRMQTWEYKIINYIIQGSAADITKEVICNWYDAAPKSSRFLVQVYDELNISSPEREATAQMKLLKDVMEDVKLDVPMRSSGKIGPTWGELKDCA
jgi:DNA polymerase I-like protein with 3'-5' exonuclease and polymerase domains